MTPTAALDASTSLLSQLANPAGRALAIACAAGLGLAAFRVKATSVRLFAWTAVLYVALAMPLLGWLLPSLPVATPAFLQGLLAQQAAPAQAQVSQPHARTDLAPTTAQVFIARNQGSKGTSVGKLQLQVSSQVLESRRTPLPEETPLAAAPSAPRPSLLASIPWNEAATGFYFAVTLVFLARFFVGIAFGRRLIRSAQILDDQRVINRLGARANTAGLDVVPVAAESDLISVPVTMGALRPLILLPADWREWDDAKLDAVVAHEVSHVARRDALTQRLSLLHRAIFWFSPLAWWLDRRLADLAEQASDEAALSCGADRTDYAKTLLGFFEALQAAPGRVWWQGVSMAKAGQAEQRVDRILAWKGAVTMSLKKSIVAAVVALAVPVVYLAASVHPANYNVSRQGVDLAQDQAPPPPAAPRPAVAPKAAPNAAPTPAVAPVPPAPRIASDVSGIAPRAPYAGVVAPPALASVPPIGWAQSGSSGSSSSYGKGYSYAYGYDDNQRFVISSGSSDSFTMSGDTEDVAHVKELRKKISGDFIWFQKDEKSYIIRDQATIDRAKQFWAPQEELGKQQEELGKQQEALGKQQEELGKKMEQVRVNVPDMTAQLDKLRAELKKLSEGGTQEQLGDLQGEIGDLQSKLGELQSQAGDKQGELGKKMGELGRQQGKLGEQQGLLGERQGELARQAALQMKELLNKSLSNGTAQPEQ